MKNKHLTQEEQRIKRRTCFQCVNFLKHTENCVGCDRTKLNSKGGRQNFVLDDYWKN